MFRTIEIQEPGYLEIYKTIKDELEGSTLPHMDEQDVFELLDLIEAHGFKIVID